MLKNKRWIPFLMLMFVGTVGYSQSNNTNTPYSRYGYGKLGDHSIGMSRAMGGVGYGLRTNQQINPMNPASYTAMDSLTFLFDIGADIQFNRFEEGDLKNSDTGGGFDYVALQFPLGRRFAASAGLLPYSYVGYNYLQKGAEARVTSNGEGGISLAYIGFAANLFKGLNLGVNVNYMFGNMSYLTDILPVADYTQRTMYETSMQVNNALFQIGAQYTYGLAENKDLTLGVVYSPSLSLRGDYQVTKTLYTPSSTTSNGDYSTEVMEESSLKDRYELPMTIGVGLTYSQHRKLTVGLDVTYQNWANANYAGRTDTLCNRLKFAAGAEYIPNFMSSRYLKAIRYRLGAFYEKSYLQVDSHQLDEYGVSCGFGLPLRSERSIVNIGFEYVRQKAPIKSMVGQDYFRISLGLTFNELWFFKPKLQ